MRRVKKSVVVVTMMLFSMILFSMTNVHAANKKLKVNKVYTTTKKIKGKTKKKYLVKVKIGKKIYKKKANLCSSLNACIINCIIIMPRA